MELSIQSDEGNLVRLDAVGRVTQSHVSGGSDLIIDLLGPEAYQCNVLLNMGKTDFLDSSGVNWLLESQKKFREGGGRLILHGVPPIVMNVLKVLHMQTIFTIANTEKEAVNLAAEEKS